MSEPEGRRRPALEYALRYAAKGWPVFPLHEPVRPETPQSPACTCGRPKATKDNLERGIAAVLAHGNLSAAQAKTRAEAQLCKSVGKHPRTEHGVDDATTDAAQIRAWWKRWPQANIGVHMGAGAGVWGLDLDEKDKGPDVFEAMKEGREPLPPTPIQRSGGGGLHLFWRLPEDREVKNRVAAKDAAGRRIKGIDVRSTGGYLVLAPSVHESTWWDGDDLRVTTATTKARRYAWISERGVEPAPAPLWVLELVSPLAPAPRLTGRPTTTATPPTAPPPAQTDDPQLALKRAYCERALKNGAERILGAQVAGHARHDVIVREAFNAGGWVGAGLLDREHAAAVLIEAGISAGKDQREVQRAVTSGLDAGAKEPRVPPDLELTGPRRGGPPPPRDEDLPPPGRSAAEAVRDEESDRRREQARTALHAFATKVRELEVAQDKAERAKLIGDICQPPLIRGLAIARLADDTAGVAELARIRAIRGLADEARRLEQAIARQVRAIRDADKQTVAAARARQFILGTALGAALGELGRDLDFPEDLVVPMGYELMGSGVYRVRLRDDGTEDHERIAHSPLFISGVSTDVDGAGTALTLRWYDGRAWRSRSIPRKTAMVARSLAEESQHDVPVSSVSASDIVGYLEAFLAANAASLPLRKTSTSLGWREGAFLLGSKLIGPDGPIEDPPVTLNVDDPGIVQLSAGYRTSGTWEAWVDIVQKLAPYPRIMLALYASLCPPLLRLVPDAPNFLVDFSGETSQGKTTTLRLAASVWGSPSERDGGLIRMWDSTATFIERVGAFGSDLPLILDDSKRAKPGAISKIVYAVSQGVGRGRGTVSGVQVSGTWRTVLLSTGEAPLTSYSTDGGAAARCLTLWGSPFGLTSQAELAREVTLGLYDNHGHLGPRALAWLQQPERADWVKHEYRSALQGWSRYTNGNAVAERAAAYLAVLEVAANVARQLGVPRAEGDPLGDAWRAVANATEAADRATLALHDLHGYAVANAHAFFGRHYANERDNTPKVPPRGWAGAWSRELTWGYVAILPRVVKELFRDWKYDYEAVVTTWRDRGWLRTIPTDKGPAIPTVLDGGRPRCLQILRDAINSVEQGKPGDAPKT